MQQAGESCPQSFRGRHAPQGVPEGRGDQRQEVGREAPARLESAAGTRGRRSAGPKAGKEPMMATTPRLQEQSRKEILPELTKQFNYTSPMAAPRLRKIVVNM